MKQLRLSKQPYAQSERGDNQRCLAWEEEQGESEFGVYSHVHPSAQGSKQSTSWASGKNSLLRSEADFMPVSANQRWQSSFVPTVLYKMGNENQRKSHLLVHILQEENQ